VVLSSQVVAKLGEYERTMTAVLDAYLQRSMQNELSAMWDRLRTLGYKGSFLMIHNSGGSGEVFKTTASRTYNGRGRSRGSWARITWRPLAGLQERGRR